MFENITPADRTIAIQRLTALWALNECGLGGFLHAIQSPFSGLFVGGFAMICIAMICAMSDHKWRTMMTSLVIVLVIKGLVSPHSPPTAYIAVLFQGVTGALIYSYIPGLLFSSILFVTLGLVESAMQRLLTLTVLYGNTLWSAINSWGEWVTQQWGVFLPWSSSQMIIMSYLGIHVLAGILIGLFIYRLIHSIDQHWGESKYQLQLSDADKKDFNTPQQRKRNNIKRYFFFIFLLILVALTYFMPGKEHGIKSGLFLVIRAVGILLVWFVFLAPLFIRLLQKWLHQKHEKLASEISATMEIFPQLMWILDKAWKETAALGFFHRLKTFLLHTMLYILQYKTYHDPDPHRTGKKS
ncbi:MAG: hypothetical protein ABJC12_04145 [Saprospiraceae bacterium]